MPKLLLSVNDFQSPDDAAVVLARKREQKIAAGVLAALRRMGDAVDYHDLTVAIQRADVSAISDVLASPHVVDALKSGYQPIADTFVEAAEAEAETKFGGLVVYDPLFAARQLAGAQQNFIGSILGQSSQVVSDQLVAAARAGTNVEEVANALRGVISLTPRQAKAVTNFRSLLENGNRDALRRALRDKRYDATVESWLQGAPVDPAKVDAMVERYATRSLAARAQTIASNESMQASVGGIRDAYTQAVSSGRLLDSEVKRFWLVEFDERLCPICASIPLLNSKGVGVLTPYKSLGGLIMAPLAHTNCRCSERYETDLSRVTANPFTGAVRPPLYKLPARGPVIHL
jgi:hypothetical protein